MSRNIVFVTSSATIRCEICFAKEGQRLLTVQLHPGWLKSALMPDAFLDCDELASGESGESFAEGCDGRQRSEIDAACCQV